MATEEKKSKLSPALAKATASDLFRQARMLVVQALPYTRPILLAMDFRDTTGQPNSTTTMGIDRHGRITFNSEFVIGMCNACGVPALAYVLVHEWMHYVYGHAEREDALITQIGSVEEPANGLAMDISINPLINKLVAYLQSQDGPNSCKRNISIPEGEWEPVLPSHFGLSDGLHYEAAYGALNARIQKIKEMSNVGGAGRGCSPDKGEDPNGSGNERSDRAKDGMRKIEQAKRMQLLKATAQETERCENQSPGSTPAGMLLQIAEEVTPPKVSWQDRLRSMIRSAVSMRRGDFESTYTQQNKKQSGLGWGPNSPVLAGSLDNEPLVGIVADTSGSMWGEPMRESRNEIFGILQEIGGKVALVACDAAAQDIKIVDSLDSINQAMTGGGGTDMRPGMEAFIGKGFDPVICITDGYIPSPGHDPGYQMIWCITNGGTDDAVKYTVSEGWGSIIHLRDE